MDDGREGLRIDVEELEEVVCVAEDLLGFFGADG